MIVMAEANERLYTVPLRKEFLKAPRVKRANRAVKTIQTFLRKHMKTEEVRVSQKVNETIWVRGIHHPPSKIKLKARREGEIVYALLPDEKFEVKKKEEKKPEAESKSALQQKAAELSEKLKKEREAKKSPDEEKTEKPTKEPEKETTEPEKKDSKK